MFLQRLQIAAGFRNLRGIQDSSLRKVAVVALPENKRIFGPHSSVRCWRAARPSHPVHASLRRGIGQHLLISQVLPDPLVLAGLAALLAAAQRAKVKEANE